MIDKIKLKSHSLNWFLSVIIIDTMSGIFIESSSGEYTAAKVDASLKTIFLLGLVAVIAFA